MVLFLDILFAEVVSMLISSICIKAKGTDEENMLLEYPMRIKYENKKAWDGGGVCLVMHYLSSGKKRVHHTI